AGPNGIDLILAAAVPDERSRSMSTHAGTRVPEIVRKYESEMLAEWLAQQSASVRRDVLPEEDVRRQSQQFLSAFAATLRNGGARGDVDAPAWSDLRGLLAEISRVRVRHGFTPTEMATFVFSLKQPLFRRLQTELAGDPAVLADEMWWINTLIDSLGLYTTEVYQKERDEVIARQQEEMLELSTPVVELWDGILALPLIGTLDTARTQVVMESLLQKIVDSGATIAVIDITGVPTVDTLVAQHLLKTVVAA